VTYYSPWLEQFQASFAAQALQHGALTVVQIDPQNVQLKDIVAGSYDSYLRSYALAIRAFGARIVVSFGHEMNGDWSSWGYTQTSATVFVAAWRHIVNVFRSAGANNVTWLWTVNVVDSQNSIPNPSPWWPGKSYVNMVGIDGYFYLPSQTFADLFGPTIVDVRALTAAPILVAETGATNAAGQPAKINELFGGIRSYGLSGFVWFDENTEGRAWRIDSPAAFAALRQNVREYMRPPTVAGATTEPSASSSP
jgi:hypothetical protein